MADAIEIIREKINLVIEKKLSQNVMTKIRKELGNLLDKFMHERLAAGIGVDGKKVPKLNPQYSRWKKRYTQGRLKHRKKSEGKEWYRKLYDTTQYKAKGVPNYGRLTGKTLMSLNPEILSIAMKGNKIEFNAELQTLASGSTRKGDETDLIVSGLRARKRYYYGLLADVKTNRGQKERQEIVDMVKRVAKL